MVHYFHSDIAQKYGINAAVLAAFIWECIEGKSIRQPQLHEGKVWFRCSVQMLTGFFPLPFPMTKPLCAETVDKKGVFLLRGISTKAALTARTGTHLPSWGNI